jgi:hypothetical protein
MNYEKFDETNAKLIISPHELLFFVFCRNIMYTTYFPGIIMDLVFNQVYVSDLWGTRNVTTSPDWQIPLGVWTHLTIQV